MQDISSSISSSVTSTTCTTLGMACNSLSNKIFLKRIQVLRMHGMQCFNCTRTTYDVYDYTSGDETADTKNAVAPELIRICPNQPCNPSILSPSCIIKAS